MFVNESSFVASCMLERVALVEGDVMVGRREETAAGTVCLPTIGDARAAQRLTAFRRRRRRHSKQKADRNALCFVPGASILETIQRDREKQ